MARRNDEPHCLSQLPGLFTSAGVPESVLYPEIRNRTSSTDIEKGVTTAQQIPERNPVHAITPAPFPEDLICCSLVSSGHPQDCVWQTIEEELTYQARCKSFDQQSDVQGQALADDASSVANGSTNTAAYRQASSIYSASRSNDDGATGSHSRGSGSLKRRSRLFSIPEGAFYGLSSFLPRHILETDAWRPTYAKDSNQDQSCMGGIDTSEEPHYILNPVVNEARYIFHDQLDNESGRRFRIDRVPAELVSLGSGSPAYLIRPSVHDKLDKPVNQSRSHTLDIGLSQKILAQDYISSMVERIMSRVHRRLLFCRLPSEQIHIMDESGQQVNASDARYLVSDDNLKDVIETVIEEMRQFNTCDLVDNQAGDGAAENCLLPKLNSRNNSITPSTANAALPATTISVPKTSFSSIVSPTDTGVQTKTIGFDKSSSATIVSRRSVAEISWTRHSPAVEAAELFDPLEQAPCDDSHCDLSTNDSPLEPSSDGKRTDGPITLTGFSVHHYTTSDNYADLVAEIGRAQSASSSKSKERNDSITSFPRLLSRHCTNDWLKPPIEIDDLIHSVSANLYNQGIDAHCGGPSEARGQGVEEPLKPRQCDYSLFSDATFVEGEGGLRERRATEVVPSPVRDIRLGTSIGSASHRRRSSVVVEPQNPNPKPTEHLLPAWMDKIRKGGHKIFHPHHARGHDSSKASEQDGSETPQNSVTEDQKSPSQPRSRDSIIRERTPELPKADRAGIYEAMTGSRLNYPRRRRGTCSEDNRPHVCQFDSHSTTPGHISHH